MQYFRNKYKFNNKCNMMRFSKILLSDIRVFKPNQVIENTFFSNKRIINAEPWCYYLVRSARIKILYLFLYYLIKSYKIYISKTYTRCNFRTLVNLSTFTETIHLYIVPCLVLPGTVTTIFHCQSENNSWVNLILMIKYITFKVFIEVVTIFLKLHISNIHVFKACRDIQNTLFFK